MLIEEYVTTRLQNSCIRREYDLFYFKGCLLFMKNTKLFVSYEYDFELLGLTSTAKEYKLAWAINNLMDFRLVKNDDLIIDFKDGKSLVISNYIYKTEHSTFRLFKNKSVDSGFLSQGHLVPELKNFDYIVYIQGFEDSFLPEMLLKQLRELEEIIYIQAIDVQGLKSKENLIF